MWWIRERKLAMMKEWYDVKVSSLERIIKDWEKKKDEQQAKEYREKMEKERMERIRTEVRERIELEEKMHEEIVSERVKKRKVQM